MFAFLHQPDINPVILQIYGPFAIRWYSLMYIIAFMFAYGYLLWQIRKKIVTFTEAVLSDIVFYSFIGVLAGGRLGYVLFYNLPVYIQNPAHIFAVWEGGMSFHGGMLGVIVAILLYAWQKKMNFFDLADVFCVPVPLGLGLGRWGNFVNGELWGRPTDAPWGVIFPSVPQNKWYPVADAGVQSFMNRIGLTVPPGQSLVNVPRHASQLYELFLEGIVLTIILILLSNLKNKPRGLLFPVFLIGYGLSRIIVEFFREPDAHIGYLGGNWLTMGMILSLPMVLIGVGLLIYFLKKNQRNPLWVSSGN